MQLSKQIIRAKKATQFMFLICGLGLSSWAPMVPFVKDRLSINEIDLGLLLLLLGLGALIMMPLSGFLMHKIGSRKIIGIGALIVAFTLPLLLVIPTYWGMSIALFIFGCGIGTVDVAMNAHGVQVQNLFGKPIMSSLHGLFSVGGLLGSLGLGFLMKIGFHPLYAALIISALLLVILLAKYKNLFDKNFEKETIQKFTQVKDDTLPIQKFQWLNGTIFLLGFLCFSVFLSEGAMLDWSAIFLRDLKGVPLEYSGMGYASFSIAMAFMRLTGDRIVERLSPKIIVVSGSFMAVFGLLLAIFSLWLPLVVLGFILLGIGAANIIPIFFSEGGKIPGVSPNISISAITTLGYAGQLAGPAILGFIAHKFSLQVAFGTIALLLLMVAVIYGFRKINKHG